MIRQNPMWYEGRAFIRFSMPMLCAWLIGLNAMAGPDELVTKGQDLLAKQRGPSGVYLTISDQDLFGSMDLERPGLERVRSAASSGDYASAYAAWGRYWAERREPVYYLDEVDYAQVISRHLPKIREIVLSRADFIWSPDYQHSTYKPKRGGRTFQWVDDTVRDSAYIGFHYWWFGEYLGRAYLLTGDEKYPAMFRELVCSWWDDLPLLAARRSDGIQVIWNSGLGSSIRGLAMVDGYYLMRKSPEFTDELHRKILRIFLGHSRYMLDTRLGAYNHWNGQATQCCWAAMASILLPEFRDSGKWLDAAVRLTEQRVLVNYDEDGAQLEMCPQYHFAGMRDITRVVWMLARNNMSDRLGDNAFRKKLELIYDFPIRLAHPTGHGAVMNSGVYGTEWLAFMPIGVQLFDSKLQAWAAKRFIEPDFVPVAKNISQYVLFMDSAWVRALDAVKEAPLAEPGFRCDLLQHSGVAVLRSGWDKNALSMVFDFNTKPYGGHAYPGRLSFDLWAHGAALVVNPGSTLSYSMPEYRQWCHRTRGHNTVMVNNKDQSRPHYAKLLAWRDGKRATFVAASTDTYLKSQGVLHQRCILFVHGEYYFVFDRLVGGKAGMPLAWLLHSPKPLEERDDGTISTPVGEPGLLIVPDSATRAAGRTVFWAGYSAVPVSYHENYKPLDAWQDGAPILRLESAFDGTGASRTYGVLLVPFAASSPEVTATRGVSTSPTVYVVELDWGTHKDEILFDFQNATPRFTLARLDNDGKALWDQGSVDRGR